MGDIDSRGGGESSRRPKGGSLVHSSDSDSGEGGGGELGRSD